MEQVPDKRFYALDVFRGATVFLMIVVNTPGGGAVPYRQLLHAKWNGCTLADLVFPSFLFAVGSALPWVLAKFGGNNRIALLHIVKRAVLIFIVGWLLGWYTTLHWEGWALHFTPIRHVRIMGVLQRIALCYAAAGILALYVRPKRITVIAMSLPVAYWLLLSGLGVPGAQYSLHGNAVRQIDIALFGVNHMYSEAGLSFDPEGLLSTIPAITNVLAGYLMSVFIRHRGIANRTLLILLLTGVASIASGWLWGFALPLNKKLWTSSYVMFTAGIDLVVMTGLICIVDIYRWRKSTTFLAAVGKNPLFIYVLSNLLLIILILPIRGDYTMDWVNRLIFQAWIPGPFGSLMFAICFTLPLALIAWWMDKKRIYLRL